MDFSQPLGPSGIASRVSAIQHEISARLGIPEPGSFATQLNDQMTKGGSAVTPTRAPAELRPLIENAARENNLDPDLLDCLVHQESGYQTGARSSVGAMGLTQLMPGTASGLGVTDPYDPAQNLMGGAKYLRQQLDRFGNIPDALAAYNAGPGAVMKYGGIPSYPETQNYVKTITSRYQKLKALDATGSGLAQVTLSGDGR
jgi:soluble lytic murein transglycosylase-like protein